MKKTIFKKSAIIIGLYLIAFPTYSALTIYGTEQAIHFKSHSNDKFYIQAGNFLKKSNAYRLQSALKNKSTIPVTVNQKNSHYIVLVGPMKSSSEVRSVAQKIRTSKPSPVDYYKPNQIKRVTSTHMHDKEQSPPVISHVSLPPSGWFIGAGLGWVASTGSNAINYASSGMPGFPDDKYVANGIKDGMLYSVNVGYQWHRDATWFPAFNLGLGYTQATPGINGVIYQNALADSKNFTFTYDVSQQLPMLNFKADLYRYQHFMPYIAVGAGLAINKVEGYSDSPILGATVQQRRYGFNSATKTQFAGSIGAGLDFWMTRNAQLSLVYQLTSSGKIRSGYGTGSLSSNYLTNKLITNSIGLQAMYFLN